MNKGWEFFWEGRRYCVGAPDAPTARKYLRAAHLHVAHVRKCPKSWPTSSYRGSSFKLHEGTVRVMSAGKVKD